VSDRLTPDTDAIALVIAAGDWIKESDCTSCALDFARKLERERNELREKIKSLTSPAIEGVLTRMKGNLEIVDRVKTERDELRAEVERLKADKARQMRRGAEWEEKTYENNQAKREAT
jgi:hypothetical protein